MVDEDSEGTCWQPSAVITLNRSSPNKMGEDFSAWSFEGKKMTDKKLNALFSVCHFLAFQIRSPQQPHHVRDLRIDLGLGGDGLADLASEHGAVVF